MTVTALGPIGPRTAPAAIVHVISVSDGDGVDGVDDVDDVDVVAVHVAAPTTMVGTATASDGNPDPRIVTVVGKDDPERSDPGITLDITGPGPPT